jgi:hypothetical protein
MIATDIIVNEFGMFSANFESGGIGYISFKDSKSLTPENTEI